MPALHQKVKNTLDEARILVLGAQVLLGFQYRGFFEKGFERLPPLSRSLELVGLFMLLGALALLFLAPARHRLVEHRFDTGSFHRFAMTLLAIALIPFLLTLAIDLFIAADRIVGLPGGVVFGTAGALFALALWYGLPWRQRDPQAHLEPEDKMEATPLEHRVVEVLTEARVVLPGAQALLGFQLAMVLMESFSGLPQSAKLVHLAGLACVAAATIVLMAPPAYHRIVERGEDTERFHRFASRMVIFALVLLAPGFCADLYVVLVRMGYTQAAAPVALAALASFYALWFGFTLALRARKSRLMGAQRAAHAA